MYISWFSISWFLSVVLSVCGEIFSHQWAVEVEGGEGVAQKIAEKHNYEYLGHIVDDVYHFRHRRLAKRSAVPSHHHHGILTKEPEVRWAEQQKILKRTKRDFQNEFFPPLKREADFHTQLTDPKWSDMWYLNRGMGIDMNVERAWADGATGKSIVVTILDDGLEKDHPDLIQNYDPKASFDVNSRDDDPMPRYDMRDTNRHGTRCAGEVAAVANNSLCAVGVAFKASVGGVRMLDGDVTDAVEARSLAFKPNHIDIYSASWGPDDDGKTVDGPGMMATRAFVQGVTSGRKGKGSIFIWASGNGGRDRDNCNCDGYTNSIWTLSISSATEKGRVPWYSEACSSTLASTYSSGAYLDRQIITTDLHHSCTETHTGTSASAPLAAGIVALALEANKALTWRDMQHIVVRTARPKHLDAKDWQTNGVGRRVSHRFGYGIMDAYGMVQLAKNWTTVPPQRKCEINAPHYDKFVPQQSYVTLDLEVSDCPGVNFLEHVQSKVSLKADERGNIEIYLISPAGTKSHLLALRPKDSSRTGFHSWPFMTVHMWGEHPLGIWKLEIHNSGHFYTSNKVTAEDWSLIFYGTEFKPGEKAVQADYPGSNKTGPQKNLMKKLEGNSLHDVASSEEREDVDGLFHGVDGVRSSGSSTATSTYQSSILSKVGLPMMLGCATANGSGVCVECKQIYYLFRSNCVLACPDGFFGNEGKNGKSCLPCHYSCKKCKGSLDYQCTHCWADAQIYSSRKAETYCHSKDLLSAYKIEKSWSNFNFILLIVLSFAVIILGFIVWSNRRKISIVHPSVKMNSSKYDRVTDNDRLGTVPFKDESSEEEI